MRISDMTEEQYATYSRGWDNGEHNAINACYPQYKRAWPHSFDTPEEADLYEQGYRKGYNSID